MRRRLTQLTFMLLVLVGVNAASAPAMRAAAIARAVHCCQHKCQKDGSMAQAKRCCLIQDDAGAHAVPAAASIPPPVLNSIGLVSPAVNVLTPDWQALIAATAAPPPDVGPIFLLARSLRL